MDFPHMDDNQFPYIDNVNPYKFVNDFDYSRWEYQNINLKLMNVLWDNSLSNVPYFESDNSRNHYFQAKAGHTVQLQSGFVVVPEATVKVPIPYNVAYTYNYVRIASIANGTNATLDYGSGYGNVNIWFYFIVDMKQLSPSTTELYIQLDYWTTFINSVNIPYMVLERGHAPMALIDVETYLADPINNNEYLLANDFDFGRGESIIKNSSYFPVSNGAKWVLFAIPTGTSAFQSLVTVSGNASVTPPTYADETSDGTVTRWGDDLLVNDYEWNFNNINGYANADIPTTPLFKNKNNIYNGYNILGISAAQATDFFNYLASNASYIFNLIEAVFVVGEDMLKLGNAFTWHNFTLRKAEQNTISIPFTLQKAAFEFDTKYANLAKLYTYPYSFVEITDDFGNTSEIRIENISGNANFVKQIEVAFPYVQYRCFFTGINGDGSLQYNWVELNNTTVNKTIWEDDFSKFMFKWEIPTYALHVNASIMETVNNHSSINAKRQAAIIEYQTADRYANTTRQNIFDSQNTINLNTQNASNTNKAAKDNYSNTNKINADASSNTKKTNNDLANDVARQEKNANNQMILDNKNLQKTNNTNVYNAMKHKNALNVQADQALIDAGVTQTQQQGFAGVLGSAVSGAFTIAGGALTGAGLGGTAGPAGALAGAAVGSVSAFSSVASSSYSAASAYGITDAYARAQKTNIATKHNNDFDTGGYMETIVGYNNQMLEDTTSNVTYYNSSCNALEYTSNGTIIANYNTTELSNNSRTNSTELQNNSGINTMEITNAQRTYNTETNNAAWNRDAAWQAANANLILRQLQAQAPYNDARLRKPVSIGNNDDNAWPDVWEQRGIRFNVRTQPKSSIAQAGDGMLRYGYTVHRVWDVSDKDFCKMTGFTFWKAEDIWITNNDKTADRVTSVLTQAFLDGLTVWANPDEIGSVSIYDNPPIASNVEIGE